MFAIGAGCASSGRSPPAELPVRVGPLDVPFVAQRTSECGPTSLAMVLAWSGEAPDIDRLVAETWVPGRGGALAPGLLAAARRHGRLAVPVVERDRLLRELAAGHPVLVMQNLGLGWLPVWHFAVAIGYDLHAREVVLHTGAYAERRVPLATFERTWQRAQRWALVVLAPDRLPATASALEVLEAIAGLERAGRVDAAQVASARATRRWPRDPLLWLANANAWLGLGDLDRAEGSVREALRHAPTLAPAHNNLADLLLRRGRLAEARAAVERAIELGGPLPAYLDTRASIERAAAGSAQ
jgi:tetratricopeptide (TPR) repeat protein